VPQYVDSLKNIAYSGNYNDLTNRPLIPTRLTDIGIVDGSAGQSLTTDGTGNFVFRDIEATSVSFNNIIDKPTTIAGYGINDAFTGRYEDLLNKPALFSGNYNDLSNKPAIPLDVDDLTDNSNLLFDGQYINLTGKPSIPTDVNQLSDESDLFFSRSYNDLTNKPNFFNGLVELSMALGVTVDEFSNDTNMTDNSATALVTERAVKTYIANQIALIPVPDQIGNFTLGSSTIDTDDSSAITITPAIIASSDLTVENDLVVRNELIVDNNITVAGVITASSFVSTGNGNPEFSSETDITLSAAERVTISSSPLKMASFTSAERDILVAQNGDVIYNTTTNKFQGYANSTWVDLH
jgi:hypothetical protein